MLPGFGCPSASKLLGFPKINMYTKIPIPIQMAMANEATANEKPPDVFFSAHSFWFFSLVFEVGQICIILFAFTK